MLGVCGALLGGSGEEEVLSRHGRHPTLRRQAPCHLSSSVSPFSTGPHSARKNLTLHVLLPKQCSLGGAEDGQLGLGSPVPSSLVSWAQGLHSLR